jgi:ferric-dicitrate binding protein FerR (iron transport regulator)
VSACYAKANTAPTGADLNIIVNRNGAANIFTTDLTIPAGSVAVQTELGIAAAGVLTAGQYLTIDITQVGAVVPGQEVSVVCIGN